MNNTIKKKLFYSPQFSELAAVSVRRLAWAIGVSMPAAVDFMVRLIPSVLDQSKICFACQDKTRCQSCGFRSPPNMQEQAALLSGVAV